MMRDAATYRGMSLRYGCRKGRLPESIGRLFVPLFLDDDTRAWIDDALENPHGAVKMLARQSLSKVMSDYDANALLDAHDMRVLGELQWRMLLGERACGRLLDVGAGDGRVTAAIAPLFDEVETTELSPKMAKRLRERGYVCHERDVAAHDWPSGEGYDLVSILNVIDRTSRPLALLERAASLLRPGGHLVVAVPLPLAPHVYVGPMRVDPEELLPIERASWEQAATVLVQEAFSPLGLELAAMARAPYLCRGGSGRPVVALDDALFVLRSS